MKDQTEIMTWWSNERDYVYQKFIYFKLKKNLKTMEAIMKSGLVSGVRKLMGFIKILARVKEIFMIEFEKSTIKQIPPRLGQNDLPMSFKFYDPILSYTREKLTLQRKQYFQMKRCMSMLFAE